MASLLSYWYYLRVVWYMWFRDPIDGTGAVAIRPSGTMKFALVAAIIGIIALGVFPGSILGIAERSATALIPAPGAAGFGVR